jgi:uracil permease
MEPQVVLVDERPPLLVLVPLLLQHLLAMFGGTVLVPVLLGVDPVTILLFNGIGVLIFLIICQWKVSAYLGSSFAFIHPAPILIEEFSNTIYKIMHHLVTWQETS